MKAPLLISLIYCSFGVIWILLSDHLLLFFISKNELSELTYLQTIKGFFYVFTTALLLYLLIRSSARKQQQKIVELELLNDELAVKQQEIIRSNAELEASEYRYEHLFQICPLPLWIFDVQTMEILEVNNTALNHYGYTREEMLSMTISDLRPAEEVPKMLRTITNLLAIDSPFYKGIFKHRKKNGDVIEVEIRSEVFNFKNRKATLVLVNDVTELLNTQRSLKASYDNIVNLEDRERERFAAELHDGLGQNLIAIKQFITLANNTPETATRKPILKMLMDVVDNTIHECRQIIYDMRPKELYTDGLISMIQHTCERLSLAGNVRFHLKMDAEIDRLLSLGDKFQVYRMLQENLNNTLKYAGAKNITLTIDCTEKRIRITFSDDGVGIPESVLQSESTFLAIKQRLVPIGGTLKVCSTSNKGVSFLYTIPLRTEVLSQ